MRITNHKNNGVKLKFNNGVVLSTIWGYGTYSDNHDWEPETIEEKQNPSSVFEKIDTGSTTVEFMFVEGDEKLVKRMCKKYGSDDNPSGYITVERWLEMVNYLRKLK